MADQKGEIAWRELLLPDTSHALLRLKLQRQLEKDFEIELDGNNWAEQIMAALYNLAQAANLSHVLYRIDLAEGEYEKSMQATDPWQALTLAVLKREATKVILRSQLSGG